MHEGEAANFHDIIGTAYNDKFACRFDYPLMPEFSCYSEDYRGRWSPDPDHDFLFMGWRRQLRVLAGKMNIRPSKFFRELKTSPDITSEEVSRKKLGWL